MNTPNPNPSPELLPCPFCGGEATLVTGGRGTLVRCYNDQCISGPEPFNDFGHLQAAVDAWNTRALSQTLPAPGEVEGYEAAVADFASLMVDEVIAKIRMQLIGGEPLAIEDQLHVVNQLIRERERLSASALATSRSQHEGASS